MTDAAALAEARRDSPCTGVCRLDATSGWCIGCGRTGDEIARWTAADAHIRHAILAELPGRMAALAGHGAPSLPNG